MDQAILSEEDKVVLIRFGHDWDKDCMKMDETLFAIAEKVKNFCVCYLVDITTVPDFNKMYELYDPCTVRDRCFSLRQYRSFFSKVTLSHPTEQAVFSKMTKSLK